MEVMMSFLVALAANVLAGLVLRYIETRKPRKRVKSRPKGKHAKRG